MNKYLILALFFMLTLLGACGESTEEISADQVKIDPTSSSDSEGIVSGSLVPGLTKVEGERSSFQYIIKNQTPNEVTLSFNSGQEIDYILWKKDAKGTMVYHYSAEKSFTQAIHEKTLKQGEELVYDIDLSDNEPGSYILEVWMTSSKPGYQDFHQNLELTISNETNAATNKKIRISSSCLVTCKKGIFI